MTATSTSADNVLLPTSVVGSYALPGWYWVALEQAEQRKLGRLDVREARDDAVRLALADQEAAGVDVITDGEMRRQDFTQGFLRAFSGMEPMPFLRMTGDTGFGQVQSYRLTEQIQPIRDMGLVAEFEWARARTQRPLKVTCPGPLTLALPFRIDGPYHSRLELAADFSRAINAELKRAVAAGADFIQIDEPALVQETGSVRDFVDLFNQTVEGVNCKLAIHICFGNFRGRPNAVRSYRSFFPDILDLHVDQFVLEFANRELIELDLWQEFSPRQELAAGLIDVKSYFQEQPADVAERVRRALHYVPAEQLWVVPDCGFRWTDRTLASAKLMAMVAGTRQVRYELAGDSHR